MDDFDEHVRVIEEEFLQAIRDAYQSAQNAIDIPELIAAIEAMDAGDGEGREDVHNAGLTYALNIEDGMQSDLAEALVGGLAFAVFGAIILSMKRFAAIHRSRVVPEGETARLKDEIRRNVVDQLARKAHDAPLRAIAIMRQAGMDATTIAKIAAKSIALSPDQAASVAYFSRILHRAMQHPSRQTLPSGAIVLPIFAINDLVRGASRTLNAAQRSALKRVLTEGIDQVSFDRLTARHIKALTDYRQTAIARQEAIRAVNAGDHLAFRQGQANRSIPRQARRYWEHRGDERVRDNHRIVPSMNPLGVGANEPFQTPNGPTMFPPLEVNCRCRVAIRIPEGLEE